MKKIILLLPLVVLASACQKKPDDPAPVASVEPTSTTTTTTQPPPPVTSCKGATVLYSLPAGNTVADNSSKDFTVLGFDISCGDLVDVFIRGNSGQPWFKLGDVDLGASYYSLAGQVVTVHNRTGIFQDVDIEATLK